MSKPVVRVIFAVVISAVVLIAVFSNVQAGIGSFFVKNEAPDRSVFLDNDVLGRASFSARPSTTFYQFENLDPGSGHDCEREGNPSLDG